MELIYKNKIDNLELAKLYMKFNNNKMKEQGKKLICTLDNEIKDSINPEKFYIRQEKDMQFDILGNSPLNYTILIKPEFYTVIKIYMDHIMK